MRGMAVIGVAPNHYANCCANSVISVTAKKAGVLAPAAVNANPAARNGGRGIGADIPIAFATNKFY